MFTSRFRKSCLLIKGYLTAGLLCIVSLVQAQFYPVQSTPQLVPPYSVYLSDYATPGNEKLRVILVQRDLTQPSYQLRLVMSVELNGKIIMRTSRTYNPPPISLNPGIPTVISGADLSPYLDSRNIDFVGYSKEQYERTKALPEGSYQIIFTAYDYRRQDVQVSNAGSSFYYLAKSEPPLINYPACGSKVLLRTPQQIVFSWLSRNTSSPNSAADTQYQLELFETRPAGRNPNDIVLSTQPVFKTLLDVTQYVYTPADPLLLENMVYVWRVRAIDRNGKDAFRNNGYSEVCTFTYGATDPDMNIGVVKNLQAESEAERRGRVWWDTGDFDAYRANYRKTGDGYEWFTANVTSEELTKAGKTNGEVKLFDLEPDTEYEARVQGKKKGYFGGYTDIVKFRTPPHQVAQCGDNTKLPYGDMSKPLNTVIKGTVVQLDDMEIMLLDVTPLGGGWYSGIAKTSIPYFGGANFALQFERLFIDENRVAGYGRVNYISKGIADMLVQQSANVAVKAKEQIQKKNREEWEGTVFYDKIISYDIAIDTITSEGIGYLNITDSDGNVTTNAEVTQILLASSDKAIIIQDKNGDQFVVQKDGDKTKITKVAGGGLQPTGTTAVSEESIDIIKEAVRALRKEYDDSRIRSLTSDLENQMQTLDKYVQGKQKNYTGNSTSDDVEIMSSSLELSSSDENTNGNTEFDRISDSYKRSEVLYNRAIVIKWLARDLDNKEAFTMIAQGLTVKGQIAETYIKEQKQQGKSNDALVADVKAAFVDYITVVLVEKMYQKL
jgi:hypothetical protein